MKKKNRHHDPDAGTARPETRIISADQQFTILLGTSSLGTPAARRLCSSTPTHVIDDVRRRRMERHPHDDPRQAAAPVGTNCDRGKASRGTHGPDRPAHARIRWSRIGTIAPVAASLSIIMAMIITALPFIYASTTRSSPSVTSVLNSAAAAAAPRIAVPFTPYFGLAVTALPAGRPMKFGIINPMMGGYDGPGLDAFSGAVAGPNPVDTCFKPGSAILFPRGGRCAGPAGH